MARSTRDWDWMVANGWDGYKPQQIQVALLQLDHYNNNMNTYRDKTTGRFITNPADRSRKLHDELYRAFDHFNELFADGKLPKVVITIQESGRRNAYGWFGNGFWSDRLAGDSVPEINLSAEYLSRGSQGLLETLLHEMAHLWNACVQNVRDCSGGQYHNKHFKTAAERFGLAVSRDGNRGWSHTKLTETSQAAIDALQPDDNIFKSLRRKRVKSTQDRYLSLIVNLDLKQPLKQAVESTGMKQREFVEFALTQAINAATT